MFAIQEPDPTAGVITAEYIMRNETGIEEYYPIDMVSCDEMLPGGKHEGSSNNKFFDLKSVAGVAVRSNFLCPIGLESLHL